MNKLKIFKDYDTLAKGVADFIVSECKKAIAENDRFTIALSGGSTPKGLFELLTTDRYKNQIDWKKFYAFWGDERCVAEDSKDNNSHEAIKILFDHVPIPKANMFRIPVALEPQAAAEAYQQKIINFFKTDSPVFDVNLLGMGDNGHTASLFPHTSILKEEKLLVKAIFIEEVNMYRISFTIPLINASKNIVFMMSGEKKADMLQKVLEGEYLPEDYPAQFIKAQAGNNLYWYVDEVAAKKLTTSS